MPDQKPKIIRFIIVLIILIIGALYGSGAFKPPGESDTSNLTNAINTPIGDMLASLPIKGRAPKTGYTREQFGNGWQTAGGCDTRNRILARDMTNIIYVPTLSTVVCKVQSGTLQDPYSGKTIAFTYGKDTSSAIQIDHVVALSDAWQKGAQQLSSSQREALANDPLELLAVDGNLNQQKEDGDAATWLPPNKTFRCQYVTKQIQIKKKYNLWVTRPEYDAMNNILANCNM